MIFGTTPSQTVGPYFQIGLPWAGGPQAVPLESQGAITITGAVYHGAGDPVPDGLIETWQADPSRGFADLHHAGGEFELGGFRGFARACTDDDGSFEILTVKPGRVTGPSGRVQAPHVDVSLFARGLLHRCGTRSYFADEEEANAADPVFSTVPRERRETLLAQRIAGGYRFDIRLQGPRETVFFAV